MNFDITDVKRMVVDFIDNAFDGIDIYCKRYVLCMDDIGTESDLFALNIMVTAWMLSAILSPRDMSGGF